MSNEADTCRKYITPALVHAGWETEPHAINEHVTFTDGRIIPVGEHARRKEGKRADYILRYRRDFAIAVVEAKADTLSAGEGLQQAKDYAEIPLRSSYQNRVQLQALIQIWHHPRATRIGGEQAPV